MNYAKHNAAELKLKNLWRRREPIVMLPAENKTLSLIYRYGFIVVVFFWASFTEFEFHFQPVRLILAGVFIFFHLFVDIYIVNSKSSELKEIGIQLTRTLLGFSVVTAFLFLNPYSFHHGGVVNLYLLPILEGGYYFRKRLSIKGPIFAVLSYSVFLILTFQNIPAGTVPVDVSNLVVMNLKYTFLFFATWFGISIYMDIEISFRRRFVVLAAIDNSTISIGFYPAIEEILEILNRRLECSAEIWSSEIREHDITLKLEKDVSISPIKLKEQNDEYQINKTFDNLKSIMARAVKTDKIQAVPDVKQCSFYKEVRKDTRSELAIPLRLRNDEIWVLNLESSVKGAFSSQDIQFAKSLQNRIQVALSIARQEEKLRKIDAFWREVSPISPNVTWDEVARIAINKGWDFCVGSRADKTLFVQELNPEGQLVMLYSSVVRPDGTIEVRSAKNGDTNLEQNVLLGRLGDGITGTAAKLMEELYVMDVRRSPVLAETPEGELIEVPYNEFLGSTRSELAIPLIAGKTLLGILNVESTRFDGFSEEDKEMFRSLAMATATALANVKRYQRATTDLGRLETIGRELINIGEPLEEILKRIATKAHQYVESDLTALFVRDIEMNSDIPFYKPIEIAGKKRNEFPERNYALGEGIIGAAAEEKQSSIIKNIRKTFPHEKSFAPWIRDQFGGDVDWDILAIPLFVQSSPAEEPQNAIGVLAFVRVYSDNYSKEFHELDVIRGETVGGQLALLMESRLLLEKNRQHTEHLEVRNKITDVLIKESNFDRQLQEIARILRGYLQVEACLFYLYEFDRNSLILRAESGWAPEGVGKIDYHLQKDKKRKTVQTARNREPLCINNFPRNYSGKYEDTSRNVLPSKATLEYLGKGLWSGANLLGSLVFLNRVDGRDFQPSHVDKVRQLAQEIEVAIQFALNLKELRALRDNARMMLAGSASHLVSHEIGNRVGVIKNILFLAKSKSDNPAEMLRLFGMLEQEIQKISATQQRLSALLRIDREKVESVDVGCFVNELIDRMKPTTMEQNIVIKEDYRVDQLKVKIHPLLMEVALLNLITNSIEALAGSSKKVKCLNIRVSQGEQKVNIEVRDNGPGVEPDLLERIFEPGFTTKSDELGQGLGLFIAKRIVEAHSGDLQIESSLGEGTTFSISLSLNL